MKREEKRKIINALKSKPRTGRDLLVICGNDYLDKLTRISKEEDILCKRVWDSGWRFIYWIKPKRLMKKWKYIYSKYQIPSNYETQYERYSKN